MSSSRLVALVAVAAIAVTAAIVVLSKRDSSGSAAEKAVVATERDFGRPGAPTFLTDESRTKQAVTLSQSQSRGVWASGTSDAYAGPSDVLRSPKAFLQRAKQGDGPSAVAVFETVINCSHFSEDTTDVHQGSSRAQFSSTMDCSTLSRSEASDPLKWLEEAARRGHVASALMYAGQAPSLSRYVSEERREEIRANALGFLKKLTSKGINEAFLLLFESYDKGTFGPKSEVLAFAHLHALSQLDSRLRSSRALTDYGSRLRPGDRAHAYELSKELLARCCSGT